MAANTKIEWTGDTANVFYAFAKATGRRGWICVKVSRGCHKCYAEKQKPRVLQPGDGASLRVGLAGRS